MVCITFIKPGTFAGYESILHFFRQHFRLQTVQQKMNDKKFTICLLQHSF
jgi:hypothetical protein